MASESTASYPKQLDCSDLRCPEPIVRVFEAMHDLDAGDRIEVVATDPAFKSDLAAWAEMTGHSLVEFVEGPPHRALVEKRS